MRLEVLLKKTTPGPFELLQLGGCSFIHCQTDNAKPERIPQKEVCHVKTGIYDAALMVHCTNELPAVLDVLRRMNQEMDVLRAAYRATQGPNCYDKTVNAVDAIRDEAREVIVKAENVNLDI